MNTIHKIVIASLLGFGLPMQAALTRLVVRGLPVVERSLLTPTAVVLQVQQAQRRYATTTMFSKFATGVAQQEAMSSSKNPRFPFAGIALIAALVGVELYKPSECQRIELNPEECKKYAEEVQKSGILNDLGGRAFENWVTQSTQSDVEKYEEKGKTALLWLTHRGGNCKGAIALLLEKGVDPNVEDRDGTFPLWRQLSGSNVFYKEAEVVDLLFKAQADPNKTLKGQTALMALLDPIYEYEYKQPNYMTEECPNYDEVFFARMIKAFGNAGADFNLQDSEGRTVADYITQSAMHPHHKNDLLKLLQDYGWRTTKKK